MQLGMIGLGRMGGDMVRRLMRGGHACVVFDRNPHTVKQCEQDGATGAASLDELIQNSRRPAPCGSCCRLAQRRMKR